MISRINFRNIGEILSGIRQYEMRSKTEYLE